MTLPEVTGSPALSAIVLGRDREAARLLFYADVMGLVSQVGPDGKTSVDLGPGGVLAEVLADLVMRDYGVQPPDALRRRLGALRVEAASRVRASGAAERRLRHGAGEVTITGRRHGLPGSSRLMSLTFSTAALTARSARRSGGKCSCRVMR
jgi:hypothetical protein